MIFMQFLAQIDWNISPEIVEIGPLQIRWYGLLFALSFVIGYQIMLNVFKNEGLKEKTLESLTIYMVLGTVIGARLGHCFFYAPDFYLSNPIEILKIWEGGLASHGAALGIPISLYIFVNKHKHISYSWILDRIVIVVALAGFFIRLGNFFNSEIVGVPAEVPWAVIFHKIDDLPRHPSQMYESIAYLFIFVYLLLFYRKRRSETPKWSLFSRFLILVFSVRFLIEYTKEYQSAFESGMLLNMGQLLSIPLIALGFYMLYRSKQKSSKIEKNE